MRLLFIALLALLPVTIFAQTNYHQGYVVKNNGDTVRGYIDYREWDRTPTSIQFKINKTDENVSEFGPESIKVFEVSGLEHYISYTGVISMDKTRLPDLPTGLDTSKALHSIFIKLITAGKHLALYQQKDDTKTRFFIAVGTGNIAELRYYQYYLDMEDKRNKDHYDNKVTQATYYKGQLIYYADQFNKRSSNLTAAIEQSRFVEEDLKGIIKKINEDNTGLTNQKHAKSSRFFVGAGANYTQTEYHTTNQIAVSSPGQGSNVHIETVGVSNIATTVSPKLGAGLDIFINPNIQQLIFRTELSLSYVNAKFDLNSNEQLSFKQYTAAVTPQILFNVYNKDSFKFYLDAGISFDFSTYSDNKFIFIGAANNPLAPVKLDHYWASFPFQAGMVFSKRIELSFTYSGFSSYTRYDGFSISNRTYGAGIKYLFGR